MPNSIFRSERIVNNSLFPVKTRVKTFKSINSYSKQEGLRNHAECVSLLQ